MGGAGTPRQSVQGHAGGPGALTSGVSSPQLSLPHSGTGRWLEPMFPEGLALDGGARTPGSSPLPLQWLPWQPPCGHPGALHAYVQCTACPGLAHCMPMPSSCCHPAGGTGWTEPRSTSDVCTLHRARQGRAQLSSPSLPLSSCPRQQKPCSIAMHHLSLHQIPLHLPVWHWLCPALPCSWGLGQQGTCASEDRGASDSRCASLCHHLPPCFAFLPEPGPAGPGAHHHRGPGGRGIVLRGGLQPAVPARGARRVLRSAGHQRGPSPGPTARASRRGSAPCPPAIAMGVEAPAFISAEQAASFLPPTAAWAQLGGRRFPDGSKAPCRAGRQSPPSPPSLP